MRKNLLSGILNIFLLLLTLSVQSIAQTTPDPGIAGPYAVSKGEYNLGDAAASLTTFTAGPVEMRASVHYPTGLAGGPYPVIVLLHGRHSTCYNTTSFSSSLSWPCPTGTTSIESFQGYDYHARFMASHGYIVISVSCNGINARDNSTSDRGMNGRGELVQKHLNLWNTWNTTGGAPSSLGAAGMFVGKVNLQKVGTMGHSRGGEGVVFHALYNQSLGSPYGVKAVISLAPVDFLRRKLNNVPLMNIAPYCDGDVSDLQGVHFYDDVRYTDPLDEAPKYNVLMMGANHNYYNSVWTPGSYPAGTSDDWGASSTDPFCGASVPGNKRLDTIKQKKAYNSYASAFFRRHVGGELQFSPILETKDVIPPASSMLDTSNVFVSYHPGRSERIDINRIDTVLNETTNTMGGAVTMAGLVSSGVGICGGGLTVPLCNVATAAAREPHRGSTTQKGLSQMGMRWDDTLDWYQNDIPATYQDLSYIDAVQFRAALRFNQTTAGQNLDFTVQLIDSAGAISSKRVHDYSYALFYQPGTNASLLPKVMFNNIRIPVGDFAGIDRSKVRAVKFLFNKSSSGSVLISDLAFVNSKCGKVNGTFGFSYDTIGYDVTFYDTIASNTGDTISRFWRFGNPTSGLNDTSTLHNPTHYFTGSGSYTVCLYTMAKRQNGWVCTDTTCSVITIVPAVAVTDLNPKTSITIVPNPARDYIQVFGAKPKDVLRLINSVGQVVMTTELTENTIYLPSFLANGIYYAIITSEKEQTSTKLLINR
jgi:hypothetical protein